MEQSTRDIMERNGRLRFLLDLVVLDHLSHPESLRRMGCALEYLKPGDRPNFTGGYSLAVATSLYSLLKSTVYSGHFLGFEYDDGLARWLRYGFYKHRGTTLSAVSDSNGDLARLCQRFDDLFGSLRRSGRALKDTIEAIQKCGTFGSHLRKSLGRVRVVTRHDGREVSGDESLLSWLLAERVWDYSDRLSCPDDAYQFVWGGDEEPPRPNEEATLEAETHLDDVVSYPLLGSTPMKWRLGLYFGLEAALRMESIALPLHSTSHPEFGTGENWTDELGHVVNRMHPEGGWPSFRYGLGEFAEFSRAGFIEHLQESATVTPRTVPAKERLAALLGPDLVRLFTPGSFADFMDLEIFVSGAIATHPGTQVEILIATHTVESDDRHWVSIAVRSGRETFMANHSRWYLFFKMYHEGLIEDSAVGRAKAEVEGLLRRCKGRLKAMRISGITDRDLLSYCDPTGFEALQALFRNAVDVNSALRGGVAELLAAHWLLCHGYGNVRVSLSDASLGEHEYDALGVKRGACLVVEVKGGNVTDKALQEKVAGLGRKVAHLRERLPALARALNYEGSISRVEGLFISLADSKGFGIVHDSLAFWDYRDFLSRLQQCGLSSRTLGLLDKGHIIRLIDWSDVADAPIDSEA